MCVFEWSGKGSERILDLILLSDHQRNTRDIQGIDWSTWDLTIVLTRSKKISIDI